MADLMVTVKQVNDTPTSAGTARQHQIFIDRPTEGYYRDGCRASRFIDLDVVAMGGQSVLGTATWQLLGENGSVLKEWRQSYNLVRVEKGWQILASTYHVG